MHFSQKLLIYQNTEFEFGEKQLIFSIDGEKQKVGFTVPYVGISAQKSIQNFRVTAISRLARVIIGAAIAAYVSICIIGLSLHRNVIDTPLFAILIIIGGCLIFWSRAYAKVDATVIPIDTGNKIIVLHDHQHQAIVDEIFRRRRSEIKRIHGRVDTLNHPELELKKFLQLKEGNIISSEEFDEARCRILSEAKTPATSY